MPEIIQMWMGRSFGNFWFNVHQSHSTRTECSKEGDSKEEREGKSSYESYKGVGA